METVKCNFQKNIPIRRQNIRICLGPTGDGVVTLKTRRREVPGSNLGRACRPSRSEFSVVFSETRVSTV